MDIAKSLTYIFDDERWITKSLIGVVMTILSIFIIPIFFVEGYMVHIVRNVMAGEEHPLPEWHDWGKLFMDGINLFIALLVYTLPIWLLMCCGALVFAPAAVTEGDVSGLFASMGVVAGAGLSCLLLLFGIAIALLTPAVTIQYARTDSLSACFQFSEIINMTRDNLSNIIIALLVLFGVSLGLSVIGVIPLIGWLIALAAGTYLTFVSGHLFGQIGAIIGGSGKEKDPGIISQ